MQMDGRKNSRDIARGTAASYGGFLFRLGVRIPFLFLAGMLYGETLYGGYVFAIAFVETVAVAALWGFRRSLFGFLEEAGAQQDDQIAVNMVRSCWALCALVGATAALAISLGAEQIAVWMRSVDVALPTRIAAWGIPLTVSADILLAATRFKRRVRYEVYARSVAEPVALILLAVTFYLLDWKSTGLPMAYCGALMVALLVSYFGYRRCYRKAAVSWIGIGRVLSMLHRSAPTAGYDLLRALLNNTHVMLMAYFFSEAIVGIYGVAVQFTTLINKIAQGFEPILAPVVAQLATRGEISQMARQISQVIRWILSIQFVLLLLFGLYGDAFLGLIGEQFAEGAPILRVLVVAVVLSSAFACNDLPLIYIRPEWNLQLIVLMLVVNVGLILLLAPGMGPIGVAWSMVITYLFSSSLTMLLVKQLFRVWPVAANTFSPLWVMGVALACGIALKYLGAPVWAALPCVIGLYLLLTNRFLITETDKRQIRQILKRG